MSVPPTLLVVKVPVVLTSPAPLSAMVLFDVRLTPPLPELSVPVTLIAPVLFTLALPAPPSLSAMMVNGAALLVRAMLPLVLLLPL